jgi:myosin-5
VNLFQVIGFTAEEQQLMFRTLAALLHFGNVDFTDDEASSDGCIVSTASAGALDMAQSLLGFEPVQFDGVLRFRRLVVGAEVTMRPLKADEVQASLLPACYCFPIPPSSRALVVTG